MNDVCQGHAQHGRKDLGEHSTHETAAWSSQTDIPLRQTVTTVVLRPVLLSTLTHPLTTLHRGVVSLRRCRGIPREGCNASVEFGGVFAKRGLPIYYAAVSKIHTPPELLRRVRIMLDYIRSTSCVQAMPP